MNQGDPNKKSVTGAIWQQSETSKKDKLFLQQKYGVSEIVADIALKRNPDLESLDRFLFPKLKNLLPDPFLLLDMKKAVERIKKAITFKERVVVYGDYDVDGATSSALLKNYFKEISFNVEIYIPDRILEGYGPNKAAFQSLADSGYTLCITVDCGIVAHAEIAFAKQNGLDVIVVDHHISTDVMPDAVAVVNPNRIDQPNVEHTENLAAVGVCFFVLIAINVTLRREDFFIKNNIKEPKLINFLDLVALGTVCDIVKLTGINRAFVARGLKIASNTKNLGFRELLDKLEIFEEITAYHMGYVVGPHINAGGRISKSSLGSKLLSTEFKEEAEEIADLLKVLNLKRKEIESEAFEEAILQATPAKENFIMVASKNWHPGIIGIVASRLKDHFYLPTFVISKSEEIGKASARSIKGTNLGAVVIDAKSEGIIIEGGGHKMAAGFSVNNKRLEDLAEFFKKKFANIDKTRVMDVDCQIPLSFVTESLCKQLEKLEPYGVGNPEPRFIISDFEIKNPKILKDQHVSCFLVDQLTGRRINAIAFKSVQSKLGSSLLNAFATKILAKIKLKFWQGRSNAQIIIDDALA